MSELPKGWAKTVSLFDICRPKQWKTVAKKDLLPDGYPVYGANGKIGFFSTYTHENPTVMITCRGASCGNIHISEPKSYINGNAMALDSLDSSVDVQYLFYALRFSNFDNIISGSAQPQITQEGLKSLNIPLPKLEEQKRIADKLDSVLAKVEAAQARLDKIPAILKRFRQSVLAAATSGELTKDWRANNECFLSLAPINIENDAYDVWKKTTKKDIPYTWRYFKLMEMGKIQGGGTPSKSISEYWDGDIPWVTPKDMKIAFISSSKINVTEIGVENSSAKFIEKDSILFVVRGMILAHSFPLAKNLKKVTVNQDMKAITPLEEVDSNYLLFAMQSLSPIFVELASSSTHGTKRLEAKMYNNVAIPVPPLREQLEIVRATQKLFTKAELIEKQYSLAKARINKLSQSVLAKAFKGELFARSVKSEIKDIENSVETIHA